MPSRSGTDKKKQAGKPKTSGRGHALSKRTTTKKIRRPTDPSLLILECNAEKLDRQSMAFGNDIYKLIKGWLPSLRVEIVRGTAEQELLKQMAMKNGPFNLILVVGHSNRVGIQVASDRFDPWNVFATWIAPFNPKEVLLIACESGRWLPAKALFDGLRSLKEIYASPLKISKSQAILVGLMVFYLLIIKALLEGCCSSTKPSDSLLLYN